MSLKNAALLSVFAFMALSIFLFIQHEIHTLHQEHSNTISDKFLRSRFSKDMNNNIPIDIKSKGQEQEQEMSALSNTNNNNIVESHEEILQQHKDEIKENIRNNIEEEEVVEQVDSKKSLSDLTEKENGKTDEDDKKAESSSSEDINKTKISDEFAVENEGNEKIIDKVEPETSANENNNDKGIENQVEVEVEVESAAANDLDIKNAFEKVKFEVQNRDILEDIQLEQEKAMVQQALLEDSSTDVLVNSNGNSNEHGSNGGSSGLQQVEKNEKKQLEAIEDDDDDAAAGIIDDIADTITPLVSKTITTATTTTTVEDINVNLKDEEAESEVDASAFNPWIEGNKENDKERRGELTCDGVAADDSEVIYWKVVPGDDVYESPITPHHNDHHQKYLTFEYDNGGWNNVRMSLECIVVMAHAMGRTLVIPPQQHLYLLGRTHKDAGDKKPHDEMGFQDFFNISRMRLHKGLHAMEMHEFLAREGVTGRLKRGLLPPDNSSEVWGGKLWNYLNKVADATPMWMGQFLALPAAPAHSGDSIPGGSFNFSTASTESLARMHAFGGDRSPVFYDDSLRTAKHVHFRGDGAYRVLQHHYAFTYFEDRAMASFYKRFVRDYMRYDDIIQCAGAKLLRAVRKEAKRLDPASQGNFYALHIRRGDFQFKDVKIGADQIVKNMHFPNGTAVIPRGAVVYLSTDDPEGKCRDCFVNRQPCTSYKTPKPPGCPEDTSWNAFKEAGWQLVFLNDFLVRGDLTDVNPNLYGMVESIVCSRASRFAGTWFSTFTGYIHRMRGYHGLGEHTYYHTTNKLLAPQNKNSVGHGFTREWRAGWTDDGGELI